MTDPAPPPICARTWTTYGRLEGTAIFGDTEHVCGGPPGHSDEHLCGCGERHQPDPPAPQLCPQAA